MLMVSYYSQLLKKMEEDKMATIKEWEIFFIEQHEKGKLNRTVRALNDLPRYIYSEFWGLEQIWKMAKNTQSAIKKYGLETVKRVASEG